MSTAKHTAASLRAMKAVARIPMLTAYTTPVARALEKARVPVLLVGDTVGMVEMGFDSTRQVTLDHMCYHVGAVRRGAPATHIIGDLPYETDGDPETALRSARALITAGADSVKLEGPKLEVIRHLVAQGIDVVGHTGLTPQTSTNFKQVGREAPDAQRILDEARAIAGAGAFLVVLEHIPAALGEAVTRAIAVPTIGIGAGSGCDGQVLVINDAMGLGERWPPFSRQYAFMGQAIVDAAATYVGQVTGGTY
ncbi:3-methyl-2-oxobutanoate hydroxymethyltransferase [Solimonas fluminis]|uniref:3-methyl-2-oxobutanoate hydroxymethyltransferase n=1 Tax=Solimonas fluminis TaxID=2086571 RepID=A0A2S5TBP8_9GAMM|nr:3-methyl-2-oxobutanoate hydroxymethyltransferase [Solimonas fluminis]PPE72423.1 3-methyl-2-oxobutanoate hydroxymethyltransferase [Solimonas fluminis]